MTLAYGVLVLRGGDIAIPPAECETVRRAPCIHQKRCSTSAHACTVLRLLLDAPAMPRWCQDSGSKHGDDALRVPLLLLPIHRMQY